MASIVLVTLLHVCAAFKYYMVGVSVVVIIIAYCLDVFFVFGVESSGHKFITIYLFALRFMFVQHVSVNIWLPLGILTDA
jgi:hypothetical protein